MWGTVGPRVSPTLGPIFYALTSVPTSGLVGSTSRLSEVTGIARLNKKPRASIHKLVLNIEVIALLDARLYAGHRLIDTTSEQASDYANSLLDLRGRQGDCRRTGQLFLYLIRH